MSKKHQYSPISIVDGFPTFEGMLCDYIDTFKSELVNLKPGQIIITEIMSEAKSLSVQQIRWWKGILLPQLSAQSGDTVLCWENRLKTAVMPDDFQPTVHVINGVNHATIPSISSLSMKKMNLLTEGTVEHLHDPKIYGDQFTWVTLPDSELRK